jgi:hypothetical protein
MSWCDVVLAAASLLSNWESGALDDQLKRLPLSKALQRPLKYSRLEDGVIINYDAF